MLILGVDAHKRTHTVVVTDATGKQVGVKTLGTTTADHLELVRWADRHGNERCWAVEDCRHLSRRLERDLLAASEAIIRVLPKLMAGARNPARTYGKSDPIDALAVARAALREPNLPIARLDGPDREVRPLVDHREDLVGERTRIVGRLRWLDPSWEPNRRSLDRAATLTKVEQRLEGVEGLVARIARSLVQRCRDLTVEINALEVEITALVEKLAPSLLAI